MPTFDRIERTLLHIGVFLAPLYAFRPTEFAFTFSDFVFCLLGLLMMARRKINTMPLQDITIVWMFANLCLLGGLYLSSIINGSATAALVACTQYFFAYVFLPFIIMGEEKTAISIAKTLIFSIMFILICGFIFAATGYNPDYTYISGSGRLASFYGDPNSLGIQLALIIPLVMYLWFSNNLSSPICLIIVVCIFIGLIMASSNSGIGSAVLGIGAFLLLAGSFRWLLQGALLGATLVMLAATIGYDYLPSVFQDRVLSAVESGDIDQAGTFNDRLELIIEASDMLDGSLLLGIGADQYREQSYWQAPVHSTYLLIWVEGGTIALFGWLLVLASIAFIGIRSYQYSSGGAQCAALVISILLIFMIVATTLPHLYMRFWIMPAFIAINLALSKGASLTASRGGRWSGAHLETRPYP